MSDNNNDYGLLINKDIKLHRMWFKQMVQLHGIFCEYRAPRDSKTYDSHGDLNAQYYEPIRVGGILQDHPDQKTMKKMGWVAELQENSLILHVPYDLEHLQIGALFDLPSGLDNGKPRRFRVISMSTIMIYPASIACEIAPEYETTDEPSLFHNFENENMPLLRRNEDDD